MSYISFDPRAASQSQLRAQTDHWRKLAAKCHDARTWDQKLGDALNRLPFAVWLMAAVAAVALSKVW